MRNYYINTFDVWGNNRDGYEINDIYRRVETIEIGPDSGDIEIIKALKDAGIINKNCRYSSFSLEWSGGPCGDEEAFVTYTNSKLSGYPVCSISKY